MLTNRKETRLIVENWRRILSEENTSKEVSQIIDKLEKVNTAISDINYEELLNQEDLTLTNSDVAKAMKETSPENISCIITSMFINDPKFKDKISSLKNESKILFINNYNLLNESFMDKIKNKASLALAGLALFGAIAGNSLINKSNVDTSSAEEKVSNAQSALNKFKSETDDTTGRYSITKETSGRDAARIVLLKHSVLKEIVKKGPDNFKSMEDSDVNSLVKEKFKERYPEEANAFADYINIHLRLAKFR